jgi:hypothetical protein
MLGLISDFELSVFVENTTNLSTCMAGVARLSACMALLCVGITGVPARVLGEQPRSAGSREVLLLSDAGFDNDWIYLPSVELATFTQGQNASTDKPIEPTFPPPVNPADALAPAEIGPLMPSPVDATSPLNYSMDGGADSPGAEDKSREEKKPIIPDLAKGILIQSNDGDLTFVPGMRIQPRYNYDANFHDNDFFINRFRLKGSGSAYGLAKYFVELQLDGTSRFETTPIAQDQNAWLDFILEEELLYFRVGMFDLPFSRDAMTSDSKLLIMDRSLIRGALAGLGLADDTVGFLFHGRPYDGHVEYAFGLFDDFAFEKRDPTFPRETDQLMPAFRLGAALLDPYPALDGYADYKASYLGQSTRLDVGINAAHLGEVFDGPAILDLTGVGGDIFAASGHYTFQAEFDFFVENVVFIDDVEGHGWYVQGGYLFDPCDPCLEFAVRYQTLDSDLLPDELRWTSVGFNWYIRDHNMKVQTDYTFRDGDPLSENVYALQFQLDF